MGKKKKSRKPVNHYQLETGCLRAKEKSKLELYLFSCEILSLSDACSSSLNLQTLVVIGQTRVTSLDGISKLVHLRELWVIECKVKDITDLQKCSKLEKLYLYSNDIDQIPCLSNCPHLKLLSLSGNNISHLRNLHSMPQLQELYLANNKVKRIGQFFSYNFHLHLINVAGNPLYHLKDIRNLSVLPRLDSVVFADPLFGECPLVSLCNYRHFIVYYLSHITQLDHYPISQDERRHVNDFFTSKITFYNMLRHKHLDIYLKSVKDKHKETDQRISKFKEALHRAKIKLLQVARYNDSCLKHEEQQMLKAINAKLNSCYECIERWKEDALLNMQILQHQLSLKVQYCGNMSFVEYTPNNGNTLIRICQNILDESLCPTVKEHLGIAGVRLRRVTKVVNKGADAVRSWESTQELLAEAIEPVFKFLAAPHGVVELQKWPFETFESEFFNEKEVVITDCLATADADWLFEVSSRKRNLGPTRSLEKQSYRRLAILVHLPVSALAVTVQKPDRYHAMLQNHADKMCRQLCLTNPEIVKPVFAIEYEYIFKSDPRDPKWKETHAELEAPRPSAWPSLTKDNFTRCLGLTEEEILKLVKINLAGQGLSTIDVSIDLPNLRELDVSYNNLTSLPRSQMLKNVEKLDVSFNNIRSLTIVTILSKMESLDASWNCLTKFLANLQALQAFTPHLFRLNLRNNPFNDVFDTDTMMLLAQISLKKLQFFNDQAFKGTSSRPMNHFPWVIDVFEEADATKFQYAKASIPEVVSETHKCLTSPLSLIKIESEKVRYMNLSDNQINHVDFLRKFPALQELCLANNLFKKISLEEPLEQLVKLNLSGNFIMTSEGITQENLPVLRYLDLSNNLITSLIPMGTWYSLMEFYCSHNQVSRLQEMSNLKNWTGLQIIDLSNNPVVAINLYKKFIIFHLAKIEYVNGRCVQESDILDANHTIGGSLDKDTLASTHSVGELVNLKQLTIVNCSIKKVNLSSDILPHLESLDLRQNQILTLWGMHDLKKLHTLCLSHNQVEMFKPSDRSADVTVGIVFASLATLYLDNNGITSLLDLDLRKMSALKHLYLQHNKLHDINGVQFCENLETMVLDHNKIQMMTEEDFHVNNKLNALLLENNKIKFLCFVGRLEKMEKLFIANNKIADTDQLKYLTTLSKLKDLTIAGNPLCKRTNHYRLALQALPTLGRIDGHSVLPYDNCVDQSV